MKYFHLFLGLFCWMGWYFAVNLSGSAYREGNYGWAAFWFILAVMNFRNVLDQFSISWKLFRS